MLASLHQSISLSCTALATTTHNNKYLAPYVLALALAEWVEGNKGCVERLQVMILARKLPYFNTKTLTLNLANLELGEEFKDFPFILFQSNFYLFILKFLIL
jgi:hypothetical protein